MYDASQQRIEYLVELRTESRPGAKPPTSPPEPPLAALPHCTSVLSRDAAKRSRAQLVDECAGLHTSEERPSTAEPVECGLMSSSGQPVPLVAMHVRASIVDLASEVGYVSSQPPHCNRVTRAPCRLWWFKSTQMTPKNP